MNPPTATAPSPSRHWSRLFFWTGLVTMLPGLQFALPIPALTLLGIDVGDPAGLFYARHWALLALCFGALLIHASRHAQSRGAIVLAATVEKLGLVLLIALAWSDPALTGLHAAAIFDGLCAVLYAAFLWTYRR